MYRCLVCRKEVTPATGVAFGALGRPLFVTCEAHANAVRAGTRVLGRAAATGAKTYAQRRWPQAMNILSQVFEGEKELSK